MVKYKIETYTRTYDHTPYDHAEENLPCHRLTGSIPDSIEGIQLFDEDGGFIPLINVYSEFTKPGDIVWKHCKKTDWYTHKSGLKVRLEEIKSGLKNANENGWIKTTLTVKIPLPSERGKNPNSHNNRAIPGLITKDINLTEDQWQLVDALGKGKGYSQGIRNLLEKV
jgi:hypothetical protein